MVELLHSFGTHFIGSAAGWVLSAVNKFKYFDSAVLE